MRPPHPGSCIGNPCRRCARWHELGSLTDAQLVAARDQSKAAAMESLDQVVAEFRRRVAEVGFDEAEQALGIELCTTDAVALAALLILAIQRLAATTERTTAP